MRKNGLGQVFTTLSGPGTAEARKVENGARWLGLAPERYPHFSGAILIVSNQYDKKNFGSTYDNFFGPDTTDAAKVENLAQMTTFGTRNMPTQFVAQFLSFPGNTVEK